MADSIRDFLLTPITSPALTDANYAAGIRQSFQNINDNFAKLLSTPFLQGADGKDFELYKQNLFEEDTPSTPAGAHLNDWGRSVLYSIYKQDNDNFNADLKTKLEESVTLSAFHDELYQENDGVISGLLFDYELNQYYPVHNMTNGDLIFADDTLLLMPYVWTYVTKNDKSVIDSQFVAQYYRFLDARLSDVRDTNKYIDYSNLYFDDMSCFLTYDPSENAVEKFGDVNIFDRVYLTPTLRYDRENGDWFWVIDGQETGISAKGVQGDTGADGARCWYALGRITQDNTVTDVNKKLVVLDYFLVVDGDNSSPSMSTDWANWKPASEMDDYNIQTGDLVFSLITDSDLSEVPIEEAHISDFGMGVIRKSNTGPKMYYNTQYSFKEYMEALQPNEIFKHIGINDPNLTNQTRGFWMNVDPSLHNTNNEVPVHMAYSSEQVSSENYENDLHFRVNNSITSLDDSSNSTSNEFVSRILLDNYLLHLNKILLEENLSEGSGDAASMLSAILNVYGDSYLKGRVTMKAKDNGSYVEASGYSKIRMDGSDTQHDAVTYNVKVKGDESKYKVTKNGSTIIEDQSMVVESSSYYDDGRPKTREQQGTYIPYLNNDYEQNSKLISQWTRFGNFCLMDSNIIDIDKVSDNLVSDFKYLYTLGGSTTGGQDNMPVNKTITIKRSDLDTPTNFDNLETGKLRLRSDQLSGPLDISRGGSFFTGGLSGYWFVQTTNSISSTLYSGKINRGFNDDDLNYSVIPSTDINIKNNIINNNRDEINKIGKIVKSYIQDNIIPSGGTLKSFSSTISFNYIIYPKTSYDLAKGNGIYTIQSTVKATSAPTVSQMSWHETALKPIGGSYPEYRYASYFPYPLDTSRDGVNKTLKLLKSSSTFMGSLEWNESSTTLGLKYNKYPEIALGNYGKIITKYKKPIYDAYRDGWYNISTQVGNFGVQFDLESISVTINKCSYTSTSRGNKYVMCPLGIYQCDLGVNDEPNDTNILNHIKICQFGTWSSNSTSSASSSSSTTSNQLENMGRKLKV